MRNAAGFSEIGMRRTNEDSYAYWWAGDTLYAAVADGLGGMGGGGHASSYVVDYIRKHAARPGLGASVLAALALESHRGLRALQKLRMDERYMATTLTVLGLRGDELVAAHCGDSRLYRVGTAGVQQLSEDHTEVQRLFKQGRLARDELASYPRRNILESAIGIQGLPVIQEISCRVATGDWLLLATDGAHGRLEPRDLATIAAHVGKEKPFAAACLALVEARAPQDNYTMIVARVGGKPSFGMLSRPLPWPRSGGNVPRPEARVANPRSVDSAGDEPVGAGLAGAATTFPGAL